MTCKCSSSIGCTATNQYNKGGFQIISQTNAGVLITNGGLQILRDCFVVCIGCAQFSSGVSDGDHMHCMISENTNTQDWHGQTIARGAYDSCMITPNVRFIPAGTILYPWVKCEQGYSMDYLEHSSTFTFFLS